MHYALVGRISSEVPAAFEFPVTEAYLRLYDGNREPTHSIGSWDLPTGTQDQALLLKGLQYLAREPLEADGGYNIGIDDRQCSYTGGPLLAVLELPFVKPTPAGNVPSPNICLLLAMLKPNWVLTHKSASFHWHHHIHATDWNHANPCVQMGCNEAPNAPPIR